MTRGAPVNRTASPILVLCHVRRDAQFPQHAHQFPLVVGFVGPQRDLAAAPLVARVIAENLEKAEAFVIACYSDPGLRAARELSDKPVFGMAETGLATALMLGGKVGVISILPAAVERHWVYARSLGLDHAIAADLPVGLSVAELADEEATAGRMLSVGRRLCDSHGATAILLGCAGMARYREFLQTELRRVVLDPTQAAVAAAITALRLGYRAAR